MQTATFTFGPDLSTKGLDAIASILAGKKFGRAATRGDSVKRAERYLSLEQDPELAMRNMPSLLRSRGLEDDAEALARVVLPTAEEVAESAKPEPGTTFVGRLIENDPSHPLAVAELCERMNREAAERAMAEAATVQATIPDRGKLATEAEAAVRAAKIDLATKATAYAVAKEMLRSAEAALRATQGRGPGRKTGSGSGSGAPAWPKEGTTARKMVDLLLSPAGATIPEMYAVEDGVKWSINAERFAQQHGLGYRAIKEGKRSRFFLTRPEAAS